MPKVMGNGVAGLGPYQTSANPYEEKIRVQQARIDHLRRSLSRGAAVLITLWAGFMLCLVMVQILRPGDTTEQLDRIERAMHDARRTARHTLEAIDGTRADVQAVHETVRLGHVPRSGLPPDGAWWARAASCAAEAIPTEDLGACERFRGECERTCYGIGAERIRDDFRTSECLCAGITGVHRFTHDFLDHSSVMDIDCMPVDVD